MLEKNKKFRVIEEGVMNQSEMGITKGGDCQKYDSCKNNVLYTAIPCPCFENKNPFCPEIDSYASCALNESYHFCPGKLDYLNCMKGMYHGR